MAQKSFVGVARRTKLRKSLDSFLFYWYKEGRGPKTGLGGYLEKQTTRNNGGA